MHAANPTQCEDHLNQVYSEGSVYYIMTFSTTDPASQAAADIIFVVDESGSMAMEHEWIQTEVYLLDQALKERGVGVGQRENLFGLVGFGRDDVSAITGITLSQLAPPDDFVVAARELQLTGILEDGYAAIDHALSDIETRDGTAKQIILVTDEDRGVLRQDLTRTQIEETLLGTGFTLNVVVNQGFLTDPQEPHSFGFGLTQNGTAYSFDQDSDSLFRVSEGGIPSQSEFFQFGNTFEDYAELAFSVGGAAWDLNQLREQGILAQAFTNAFTAVKVEEVMSVLRTCFRCECVFPMEQCTENPNVGVEQCSGLVPGMSIMVAHIIVKSLLHN